MDFYKLPMGFGMALAMNPNALNAYTALSQVQKQVLLDQVGKARSEREMQDLANGLCK